MEVISTTVEANNYSNNNRHHINCQNRTNSKQNMIKKKTLHFILDKLESLQLNLNSYVNMMFKKHAFLLALPTDPVL